MNIHEYQAKAVLRAFARARSNGKPAFTPEEAEEAAKKLGGPLWVVKSQIHAGGRGKGKFKEPRPAKRAAFGSPSRSRRSRHSPSRCSARRW